MSSWSVLFVRAQEGFVDAAGEIIISQLGIY